MSTPAPASPSGGSRTLQIVLIAIGGVLVLAVVAVIFLLVGRGIGPSATNASQNLPTTTPTATDSVAPTPTATPTPVATVAPKPVDHSTRFTFFQANTKVKCHINSDTKPLITVKWASANAVSAWYTANAGDAANDKYMQIPLSGTQDNFTDEHLFDCFHRPSQAYTLTLVAPNGQHISEHWTVTNVGDQ